MNQLGTPNWCANTDSSIEALWKRTAELEKQVAALKEFNEKNARPSPYGIVGTAMPSSQEYIGDKTPADRALEADLQAARGVKPAYKSDVQRIMELKGFIMDILSPEMYGHAVTREVRNAARRVLGIDSQE